MSWSSGCRTARQLTRCCALEEPSSSLHPSTGATKLEPFSVTRTVIVFKFLRVVISSEELSPISRTVKLDLKPGNVVAPLAGLTRVGFWEGEKQGYQVENTSKTCDAP